MPNTAPAAIAITMAGTMSTTPAVYMPCDKRRHKEVVCKRQAAAATPSAAAAAPGTNPGPHAQTAAAHQEEEGSLARVVLHPHQQAFHLLGVKVERDEHDGGHQCCGKRVWAWVVGGGLSEQPDGGQNRHMLSNARPQGTKSARQHGVARNTKQASASCASCRRRSMPRTEA